MNTGDVALANVIAKGVSKALKEIPVKVEVQKESVAVSVDDAIRVIHDYCVGKPCSECTYCSTGSCGLNNTPDYWRI